MAAKLKSEFGVEPKLKESGGGRFEISVDGNLIFSKKAESRFPDNGEVEALIRKR